MARGALCAAFLAGSALGVALSHAVREYARARRRGEGGNAAAASTPAEPTVAQAQALVAQSLSGAMQAAQIYVGDRLGLYALMRADASSTTAVELAARTGLSQRWLREWLAQQAAMGVLQLEDGSGEDDSALYYRLPRAFATVLADADSPDYDVGMIQAVPAFVARAKELPAVFKHGRGVPYDDQDISQAIDRAHRVHTRHVFIPKLLPQVADGRVLAALEAGVRCADLGCGAGCLLLALAQRFPKSQFHGFEISDPALEQANAALHLRSGVYYY
jgi:hypothetical protein